MFRVRMLARLQPAAVAGRLRRWLLLRTSFRQIRTRLTVLYTALFALAMMSVGLVGQMMIERHAQSSVRAELATAGSVFDRLWTLRAKSLDDAARVTARDAAFSTAVANDDEATMRATLADLRQRFGISHVFVVRHDGSVIGQGDATLRAEMSSLPERLSIGRNDAVVAIGSNVYRVIISPVMAPMRVGWVVFALHLDQAEMHGLERLSAIPLTATILRRDVADHWQPATSALTFPADAVDRFVGSIDAHEVLPGILSSAQGRAVAIARPLDSIGNRPEAMLLLSYPLIKALAPYRSLQIGIVLASVAGLLLVLLGSRTLADDIARPITALDDAARALEEGSRTEVAVASQDEIGRLALRFNSMSAEIIERENQIAHLAFHDALTGLPNRALFRQQLDAALQRAPHLGDSVAALCLDLDGFKLVNDSFGHPTGDALLRAVGELLSGLASEGVVARLSGDEFAIVLSGLDADRPRALAQAIVDGLREPLTVNGHSLLCTTSIGIALAPADGEDASTLLKNADLALYRAKQDGRAVFRFFEPGLDAAARQRRQLELELRDALHQQQFRLDYQPIYDIKADRICGFEALMRWHHPRRGLVSPVEFIPIAEESGLIVAMGEWVIHEACREAMRWAQDLCVAVNVSSVQFRKAGFADVVVQALARSGLAPQRLEIEITESIFLEDSALELLHHLRSLGVRIALDDFGTGYSSLSYLRSFPFDKIKIDRSFVTNVANDASAAAIVRAIVDLAGALQMETTAEGVEEPEQLAALRLQGCNSIQGFLFSRPLDRDGLARFLLEGQEDASSQSRDDDDTESSPNAGVIRIGGSEPDAAIPQSAWRTLARG